MDNIAVIIIVVTRAPQKGTFGRLIWILSLLLPMRLIIRRYYRIVAVYYKYTYLPRENWTTVVYTTARPGPEVPARVSFVYTHRVLHTTMYNYIILLLLCARTEPRSIGTRDRQIRS